MGRYKCIDCKKEWFGFKPSWWCDECRKKHLTSIATVLKKKYTEGDNEK